MKIKDIEQIFPDQNFRFMFASQSKEGKVSARGFVKKVIELPQDAQMGVFKTFFEGLQRCMSTDQASLAEKLLSKVKKAGAPLPESMQMLTKPTDAQIRHDRFKTIFPDPALQAVLARGDKDGKIREDNIATNLLGVPESSREATFTQFFEALRKQKPTDNRERCERYLSKFLYALEKNGIVLSPSLRQAAEDLQELFDDNQGTYKVLSSVTGLEQFGKYPEATLPISKFLQVASDDGFLKKYCELVERHCVENPEMAESYKARRRQERSDPGFGAVYEVQLENNQKMMLIPQPKPHKMDAFCDMLVAKKVGLIVTLCSACENKENSEIVPYYESTLYNGREYLSLGRKITPLETEVLYESRVATPQGFGQIIRRTLQVSNGKMVHNLFHLHYKNWPDVQPSPDLDALQQLHKARHELLQDRETPMVVHCKAGIGRTLNVSLTDCAMQAVKREQDLGKKPDEICINIFEMLYEIRKSRPKVTTHYTQVRQAFVIVGRLYGTN